jgi:hypothetical protein
VSVPADEILEIAALLGMFLECSSSRPPIGISTISDPKLPLEILDNIAQVLVSRKDYRTTAYLSRTCREAFDLVCPYLHDITVISHYGGPFHHIPPATKHDILEESTASSADMW